MKREEFIVRMNRSLKLVRTEYDLTQEKMAVCLGISKKTLVEIEKERTSLGWTGAVALAAIFSDSTVLQNSFGGEMSDIIKALAFEDTGVRYPRSMGGKIWWRVIEENDRWKIQQNYISQHYRLLTPENRCVFSSFHLDKIRNAAREYDGDI
ncbi:MAG: transcriptional regulator [Ruminococcus sp.]|nr:transcriptional regulator [Ruminococcus sp.]